MISYKPLKRLLVERETTINKVAIALGLSSETIYRISSGQNISTETLGKLCKILNCQPCDIARFERKEVSND